ncbi:hypothetical protein [Streptomyces sp. NPDC048248]|uniref:hypothetical protein n=1 Tax=Streptomyces sp. NPDC048248 TaxID=3365523 RepID=UPI00372486E5
MPEVGVHLLHLLQPQVQLHQPLVLHRVQAVPVRLQRPGVHTVMAVPGAFVGTYEAGRHGFGERSRQDAERLASPS